MSLARAYRDTVLVLHSSSVGEKEIVGERITSKSETELLTSAEDVK